jgi:hypothetical protein
MAVPLHLKPAVFWDVCKYYLQQPTFWHCYRTWKVDATLRTLTGMFTLSVDSAVAPFNFAVLNSTGTNGIQIGYRFC